MFGSNREVNRRLALTSIKLHLIWCARFSEHSRAVIASDAYQPVIRKVSILLIIVSVLKILY